MFVGGEGGEQAVDQHCRHAAGCPVGDVELLVVGHIRLGDDLPVAAGLLGLVKEVLGLLDGGLHLPMIAASVSTRVVSWNDAAEMNESVASDALVIPSSTFS